VTGVKPQHPETEFYWNSRHHQAGLSCADCHMERRTAAGGEVFTSHWLTSPLKHENKRCSECHTPNQQIEQVMLGVQDITYAKAREVENALQALLQRIEAAQAAGTVSPEALAQAKAFYMRGLTWWEWTAVSENSMGSHNWGEATANLNQAMEFIRQGEGLVP
jgi:nitrite reductase (cytochrome c-552)